MCQFPLQDGWCNSKGQGYSDFGEMCWATKAVDESLEGGAGVKALTQQLQRLDGVVAERVDAVLATRGRFITF